jgi:perosamine synthetase
MIGMSARSDEFLVPKDQSLSWDNFARRSTSARLPSIPQTSRRYLFFLARNAIYHSLRALDIQPGQSVLVPAFICAAAVEPIEAYGAKAVFYGVGQDCTPAFSDIEAKINGETRAILAVHYFGFPRGIRKIREMCDRHGLFLIEDCAHVLRGQDGDRPLGTFGEASVFSWRKFLPLYDGGELVLNHWERDLTVEWHKENLLFTLRASKKLLEDALPEALAAALAMLRLPKSSAEKVTALAQRPVGGGRSLHIDPNSSSFEKEMVNFRISFLSRVLLEHCALESIVAKRRENYLYLQQWLGDLKGVRPLFDDLPAGICPWVFPLFFDDMPNGHVPLRKLGIPAVTWGGVRHPGVNSAEFPSADFLYKNLVFLPIHQSLGPKDLNLIVNTVRAVRENGRADGSL